MLKDDGISTIIFAHSSHSAWETMINSLLNSDLVVTASWPIETERKGSFNKQRTATLASSIFFVCRKIEREDEAYFEDIKPDIEQEIEENLDYFWDAGIKGADFFISAIGPAIKVFGKYNQVKRYSGEEVEISEFLEFVEGHVAEYALDMILDNGSLGNLDPITRFYVIWRWAYDGNSIDFDDARKLAQALGIDLDDRRGDLFEKSKGEIHVLKPKERNFESFHDNYSDLDIIDAIHLSSYFWQEGKREELSALLEESGFKNDDHFWRVVQALSQIMDDGDSEKRMLQGLAAAKNNLPDVETSEDGKSLEDFGDNE
jgi:adenine-specific DNA methylase